MTLHTEVLVVGAGPVGLALSNFLGLYGREVILCEGMDALIDYPRGVGLDDESFRSLQAMGLAEMVLPFTVPHHVMRLVNGNGEVILTNDPQGEPLGWARKHGFIQPLVDGAMFDGLARFPKVQTYFSHMLVGLQERQDDILATFEVTAADGTVSTTQISARCVVGCEGGRSFTRKWMGVDFEGKSPSTRWVVVDVENDPLGTPNVYLGADPKRPYVSIGLPHAIRRWEFMLFDDEPSEKVEDDAFVAELLADHVPDSTALQVIRRRVFTHHGRIAASFRKGRAVIAGDAAHLMPVWMGQGWNSGMRDATNLSWKLATVLAGEADDTLLDTYDVERRDHAKAMIDLSMTFGSIIKPTDRRVAFLRDTAARAMNVSPAVKAYFADMRFKPMPRYGRGVVVDSDTLAAGTAAVRRKSRFIPNLTAVQKISPVGVQFVQPLGRTAATSQAKLDDLLGPWWTIGAWGNDPARLFSAEERARIERLGGQFVCFISETQRDWAEKEFAGSGALVVGDTTGQLKSWFDVHAAGVVFLRPDRFVAAACLAQQAPKALAAVLESMSASGTIESPEGRPADQVVPA